MTDAADHRRGGARVVNRDTGAERELDADLAVDAMGRSARTPAFLDSLGYGRPVAERSVASANYASLLMRIPAGIVNEKMTFVVPEPKRPTGGAFRCTSMTRGYSPSPAWRKTNHPVTWPP